MRRCVGKFDQAFANQIRRHRARAANERHLDEVMPTIASVQCCLWQVADQDGLVLDIFFPSRRDKLASDGAASGEVMRSAGHRRREGLSSRAENSHKPTCRRVT